jgi:hypothetical protein
MKLKRSELFDEPYIHVKFRIGNQTSSLGNIPTLKRSPHFFGHTPKWVKSAPTGKHNLNADVEVEDLWH